MWNDLTQNQKADLMDIYLKNGITSIKQMQQHYNSNLYADGGKTAQQVDMSKVGMGAEKNSNYFIDNTMNPLPEVTVTGDALKNNNRIYKSSFDRSINPYIDMFNATIGQPMNVLSPTQQVGAAFDVIQGKKTYAQSIFGGNSGIVTDNYQHNHPIISSGANLLGDVAIPLSLSPRTYGVINNLRPQNLRNWVYVSKAPVGYDGIKQAISRGIDGILSGKPADIDNPDWFNNKENMEKLTEYAKIPDNLKGKELQNYLNNFGEHALKARADIWRMYNHIPQKYNTFTPNELHPGAFTDKQGIENLTQIPPQIDGKKQVDFVNSVGGNIGVPYIKQLPTENNLVYKTFGTTTTNDLFDLHPFSRDNDRLIPRVVKPLYKKYIGRHLQNLGDNVYRLSNNLIYDNDKINKWMDTADEFSVEMFDPDAFPNPNKLKLNIGRKALSLSDKIKKAANPSFEFLKPLEDKVAKYEVGRLIGSNPVLVQYDIPWTMNMNFTDANDLTKIKATYTKGHNFNTVMNILDSHFLNDNNLNNNLEPLLKNINKIKYIDKNTPIKLK